MADKITWLLGADSSQVRAEMAAATRSVNVASGQMVSGLDRVDGAHGRLLRGSHGIAAQIRRVSQEFASGASAGDIFAASLEGIGRSLNVSLGALAGLAVGSVVVQQIFKIREEYEKLQEELKKLHAEASKSGDFQTMSQLESGAKRAEEAVKKLQDRISGRETLGGGILQSFKDVWNFGFGGPAAAARKDASQLGGAQSDLMGFQYAESDKMARRNRRSGGWQGQAQDIQASHDEANYPVHMMTEAAIKLKLAFEDLARTVTEKHMERAGMSLKEIAGLEPDVVNNSVSYERWQQSQQAKRAMGLESQGEAARLNMDPAGAHNIFNQADEAKEGLTALKPSERMSIDFKGALVVTEEYLRQIATSKTTLVNK